MPLATQLGRRPRCRERWPARRSRGVGAADPGHGARGGGSGASSSCGGGGRSSDGARGAPEAPRRFRVAAARAPRRLGAAPAAAAAEPPPSGSRRRAAGAAPRGPRRAPQLRRSGRAVFVQALRPGHCAAARALRPGRLARAPPPRRGQVAHLSGGGGGVGCAGPGRPGSGVASSASLRHAGTTECRPNPGLETPTRGCSFLSLYTQADTTYDMISNCVVRHRMVYYHMIQRPMVHVYLDGYGIA